MRDVQWQIGASVFANLWDEHGHIEKEIEAPYDCVRKTQKRAQPLHPFAVCIKPAGHPAMGCLPVVVQHVVHDLHPRQIGEYSRY